MNLTLVSRKLAFLRGIQKHVNFTMKVYGLIVEKTEHLFKKVSSRDDVLI